MQEQTRKICLLGDAGVGKTSLARRFVHQTFSDKYLTTVGVRIDTRRVDLPGGGGMTLVIWDLADTRVLVPPYQSYLRGAAGCLLVADGTRAYTLDTACALRAELAAASGNPKLPWVGLINKSDLPEQWELDEAQVAARDPGNPWGRTSAATGEGVEQAFLDLALAMRTAT